MDARRRRGAPRWDVFVSYAHKDGKKVAEKLEAGLVRRGLRVWRDDTGLMVGDRIFDSIMRAMEGSAYVVAVISTEYVKRASTMIEVGGMLQGKHRNRILPVLHKTRHAEVGAKLPMLFDTLMRDWDDGDFESLLDEIARAVGGSGRGRGRTARPGGARTGRARGSAGSGLVVKAALAAAYRIVPPTQGQSPAGLLPSAFASSASLASEPSCHRPCTHTSTLLPPPHSLRTALVRTCAMAPSIVSLIPPTSPRKGAKSRHMGPLRGRIRVQSHTSVIRRAAGAEADDDRQYAY